MANTYPRRVTRMKFVSLILVSMDTILSRFDLINTFIILYMGEIIRQ